MPSVEGDDPALTKKELSQLYWLNREIEEEKRKLAELTAAASGGVQNITGLPHVGGGDKTGNLAILIAEQRDLIELKVKQSVIEYNRLNRYIASVEDSEIRQILSLYYINGMAWREIAQYLGYQDESAPRKKHNRFLKMTENSEG